MEKNRNKCNALTTQGEPCKAFPIKGSDKCYIHSRRPTNHSTNRSFWKKPDFLVSAILTIFLCIVGLLYGASHSQVKSLEHTLNVTRAENSDLYTKLLAKSESLNVKSEEIAFLYKRMAMKSEEIVGLNQEIASSITGGSSFARLVLIFTKEMDNSPLLAVVNEGDYPLSDLNARISDLETFRSKINDGYLFDEMMRDDLMLNIGNLGANQSKVLGRTKITRDTLLWTIQFSAKNGSYFQQLYGRKINEEWRFATRVSRMAPDGGDISLLEEIDTVLSAEGNSETIWANF